MKVDELRAKLYKLDQHEVIRLAVEFYKLVPKAKKELYNLDTLVDTPEVKTAKPAAAENVASFDEMEAEVNTFITNAKAQYYLYPNKIIAKKDRATWRFKVKAWYKELTNAKTSGLDMSRRAMICANLYDLLCESCYYQYFSSDDTFNSVGVAQTDFFQSVLRLIDMTEGEKGLLQRGLDMAVNNASGPNTLHSWVMQEFVNILDTEEIKYEVIERVEKMIADNKSPVFVPNPKKRIFEEDFSTKYRREGKTNKLAEMGFRLHVSLAQYDEAIQFYKKYAIERDEEIKIYILVRFLFETQKKAHIHAVLTSAVASGIKLRSSLTKLLTTIETQDILPQYIG
jgi:hypothetical protein